MHKRTIKHYNIVLGALRELARANTVILNPKKIITDFEKAAISSFKHNFPSSKHKSCLFHFGQTISKKFKELCFQIWYQTNANIQLFFRNIFILVLIPLSEVNNQWENVILLEYS